MSAVGAALCCCAIGRCCFPHLRIRAKRAAYGALVGQPNSFDPAAVELYLDPMVSGTGLHLTFALLGWVRVWVGVGVRKTVTLYSYSLSSG